MLGRANDRGGFDNEGNPDSTNALCGIDAAV